MFDYTKMIQRAILFFPTWSDIRKRYKTSAGGKLLGSVTEEVIDIEQAIEEYKKYYFLDTYEGHEDDIMAFSYKYPVGNVSVDTITVEYNGESIPVTEDIIKLMNYETVGYYEVGNIYLNDKVDPDKVIIRVNDDAIKLEYELTNVWNIFDEFACFVDVERHPGETNSQLVKRILHRTRYKPNSTIEGLQNAIITEILSECPNITRDEIQIEQVNETNLRKAYKNFNTLLDYLNSINCDVYRWKKWDLNVWQHDFKSISYIPAVWDESITNFTNGIGYGNDCEVIMAGNTKSTDAVITLYDKSKETMYKYLSDKNIEKDIKIQFKRYNDVLSYNDVNYTIKASPLTRLSPEEITLDIFQESHDVSDIPLDEIFAHGHNIEVDTSKSMISDTYPYRIKFEAPNKGQNVEITRCRVYYMNRNTGELEKEIDLLKEKTGFILNSLGNIVSNSVKKSITRVEDFDAGQFNYFTNVPNSGGIQATGAVSTGVKTLYNLGGQSLSYNTSCELSDFGSSSGLVSFDSTDARWSANNVIFQSVNRLKKVTIKLTANQFAFDVLTNNTVDVMVRYSTTGNYSVIDKAKMGETWSTEIFNEPRYMEIVISTRQEEEIKIGNFRYSNYNVELYYKTKNDYIKMTGSTLPASNVINLKVVVTSKTGNDPIIHGIYIGSAVAATTYVTDTFEHLNNCYRELDIKSNCNVTLVKRDVLDTKDISYTENYHTAVTYKATENDSYIRLNLSDYSSINRIHAPVGQIQYIEESGMVYYNLALTQGQEASVVTIDGIKSESTYTVSLLDLINRSLDGYTFNLTTDRAYCSALVQGLIIVKNGDEGKIEKISLSSSLFAGVDSVKYVFTSIPANIGVIWGTGDGYYSDSVVGSFDYITFYNESDKIHYANNSYNLFINEVKDVPVAENFTEPEYYDSNKLNYYTVTSNTPGMDVRFYNYLDTDKAFDKLTSWSVGMKNLYLRYIDDYSNETVYDISTLDYVNKEVLAEYVNIQDRYTISNDTIINTEQYIVVPPDGMSVQYKSYDGTSETKSLLKTETIGIGKTSFKKLQYSNIDRIMYIGKDADGTISEDIKYTLLAKEGIIVWNEPLPEGTILYIKYTINYTGRGISRAIEPNHNRQLMFVTT